MNSIYLPRRLSINGNIYTETELLAASKYVVVLAEPGGGKTELMGSLAQQLGAKVVTASKFVYVGAREENIPLLIDAFDELAKIDASGIYKLLGQAEAINPTHVYLTSRSSEWDNALTEAFTEFLGHPPLVVGLCEFKDIEQREIFNHHMPGEDFAAFQAEVARFDLEALLPNPQFLKLFADAYIESERHFTDKQSIFAQAAERLAKEVNPNVKRVDSMLSTSQKVSIASDVFTKLLLSGAEGVCIQEATESRTYPLLASLVDRDVKAGSILASRLFKPRDSEGQHLPVHKIVAEYCAAGYLTKRIADPADKLTLSKCLPIIAPNSTVRDELRGLLGWMATLGIKSIEDVAIELDPYAVLANGDPSQLEHSSKRLLLKRLQDIEEEDPYFRRGDYWRRFSVAGFFTNDVMEEIKPLLVVRSDGHLRDLILELLAGAPGVGQLRDELRQLVLAPNESENTRRLANRCLLDIEGYDQLPVLSDLFIEASATSLTISAETIKTLGPETFDQAYLANFFRICAKLYPGHKERHEGIIGERYFIKHFISELDLQLIQQLLDELTKDLSCVCGKESYECDCRNGMSKIVGSMLDRYFELAKPPFKPAQIWQWVRSLNFHVGISAHQSKSVKVLQDDDSLRQGIIAHVFVKLTDRDQIFNNRVNTFQGHSQSHSGLIFRVGDYKFIIDLAFDADNVDLWASFIQRHQPYRDEKDRGPDDLRRHMREQALQKPSFMREWAKTNRDNLLQIKRDRRLWRHAKLKRRMARQSRCEEENRVANIKYIADNREIIEGGADWRCLVRFAKFVLIDPEKIEHVFGDEKIVRNALKNCLDFIAPRIPDLLKISELRCASKTLHSVMILHAACLEIMRIKGNLEDVKLSLLRALRTNIDMGYNGVTEEERIALKNEVDRLIFPDAESAEGFLRQYVEPQLSHSEFNHPDLWLLHNEEAFSHLRATLSIEWLKHFRELALEPLDKLFEIAAQYGDRCQLKEIIEERCSDFMGRWPNMTEDDDIKQKRTFWFVRAWYFFDNAPKIYWNWLKADKDTLFILYERSDRMSHRDHPYWPKLTSRKVEAILDAFIDKWPKVYLSNSWGTSSPKEETAYRFLTEVIWSIDSDSPDDAIPVLERLLKDSRFANLNNNLKNIYAGQLRKRALRDFEPPKPDEIVNWLEHDTVVTVEGLRQLVIHELQDFQKSIDGGEFNSADRFYEKGDHLNEVRSTEIIAERLSLRLEPQGITVTPEHPLKSAKRSDFTVTKMFSGKRRLLVTEVKGQWHGELYTAASDQLYERYSIHPDAEQQGIFLVIWFGEDEYVAGHKKHGIRNAQALKSSIEERLPKALTGLIDVFVLDVSKPK
ncbi:hypothetical protein [Desulfoluna spongiiphila]|uniref:Uncharacterized protein n=1 Tax=Desulfoluna spongiiphila TaxID=419481 RepID=A0A1G5J8U4_9BACT|nr:hypothetical protein [Desulfoluna spongiiphila]SCY84361.1 hypothetical protein SAMN05216233_12612 [Desulfoluna spongiiphila]